MLGISKKKKKVRASYRSAIGFWNFYFLCLAVDFAVFAADNFIFLVIFGMFLLIFCQNARKKPHFNFNFAPIFRTKRQNLAAAEKKLWFKLQ